MRFVDLFAGLGGFHIALARLGHECVFASELDERLSVLYERNFGLRPFGDIRQVPLDAIPCHDILCAGFPCQPFSKAGDQRGFDHPLWGDLFDHVLRILRYHRPHYFILENVPNIMRHQGGRTWTTIIQSLRDAGYHVPEPKRLSPHKFGVPQIRERVFIVGSTSSLDTFEWPHETHPHQQTSIRDTLKHNPPDARPISDQVSACLDVWQQFLDLYPKDQDLPSFPIWSMEFGATYPYEDTTPYALGPDRLAEHRGSHGVELTRFSTASELMNAIPSYARRQESEFPRWKVQFIKQNRDLYARNRDWLDKWIPKVLEFPSSLQKFEWNCKGAERNVWQLVIQFRASGVRVKRPTTAPSLVAMTSTQVPIIGWERRYMTPRECAHLQSLDGIQLPASATAAFTALGNAVNTRLVSLIASSLLNSGTGSTDEAQSSGDVIESPTLWSLAMA